MIESDSAIADNCVRVGDIDEDMIRLSALSDIPVLSDSATLETCRIVQKSEICLPHVTSMRRPRSIGLDVAILSIDHPAK